MQPTLRNGLVIAFALCLSVFGVLRTTIAAEPTTPTYPAPDPSLVDADALMTAVAEGPRTTPPKDWVPGVGDIPAILINPMDGSPPIIVPVQEEGPRWTPWKFPRSWIPIAPGGYPKGRVPGILKWNPEKNQWEFYPVPTRPGFPPIELPAATVADA